MNKIAAFLRNTSTGRFFIPLGIILIVFSIFSYIAINNAKDYVKTEAVVSKIELFEEAHTDVDGNSFDATYTVYVKYEVDGTKYEEEYGVFPNYKEGDPVTISYNPENPQEIAQPNTIVLPIVLLVFGLASTIFGITSIVKNLKKQKELKLQEEEWENEK